MELQVLKDFRWGLESVTTGSPRVFKFKGVLSLGFRLGGV